MYYLWFPPISFCHYFLSINILLYSCFIPMSPNNKIKTSNFKHLLAGIRDGCKELNNITCYVCDDTVCKQIGGCPKSSKKFYLRFDFSALTCRLKAQNVTHCRPTQRLCNFSMRPFKGSEEEINRIGVFIKIIEVHVYCLSKFQAQVTKS